MFQPFVSVIDALERTPSPSSSFIMSRRTLKQIVEEAQWRTDNVASIAELDTSTIASDLADVLEIIAESATAVKHDGTRYKLVPID